MSGDLCIKCAMCCDGTLFGYVQVTEAERDAFGGGAQFEMVGDKLAMRQRCTRLGTDGACSAYEIRPAKCRAFDCKLLKRVQAGEISETFAKEIVDEAHNARARAHNALMRHLPVEYMPEREPNPRRLMQAMDDAVKDGAAVDKDAFELCKYLYLVFTMLTKDRFHDHTIQS